MRASVAAEKAGFPTASIVATAFLGQAQAVAEGQGMPDLAIAEYPGVPLTDSAGEVKKKSQQMLASSILTGLTTQSEKAGLLGKAIEPQPKEIVFEGTLDEVNEVFTRNLWTDGIPVIPPTIDRVERFLRFTDRSPEEVIGVLLPENRQATVWNVAVNGVMAGCRPEYMPILLAVVEAIADPQFRVQDAGSTPGWEPLVILNGPIVKEMDFNYGSGAMRVGRQANTSVGRFLRLYMRNVAGLRIPPGQTDKGSIAYSFNVALAENEDAVAELGWQPFSADQGFKKGENVVTVQSVIAISPGTYSGGDKAEDHLETITEVIGRRTFGYWTFCGAAFGQFHPLLVISPSVAKVLARDGWTKDRIRQYLHQHAKVPAGQTEKFAWQAGLTSFSFCKAVEEGTAPKEFCESTDPDRLVPVFMRPEEIGIVVSGDPGRNQSKGYLQNHEQGPPVSKKVELPRRWKQLLLEM